ncbi:MAG: 5-formyltetrahydrofolate cyclo-ligase [Firmicutes bacterium]|nr:5-formyltetrahydrofolate cyclo-ligase [Bacillota bacterium]
MKKKSTQMLVTIGLLVALHIILSRFLSINAWNMKIGFAFVAVFVGAYLYGPVAGAVVGGLGDFLGAILFPIGAYFPGFTLNCALTGVVMGLLLYKKQSPLRVVIATLIDQLAISMWITPLWISILYGSPYWPLIVSRLPQIGIMVVVEIVVTLLMIKIMERIKASHMVAEKEQPVDEIKEKRKALRKSRIAARQALSEEDRAVKSALIIDNIIASPEYKGAKNILIYSAIRGEVSLDGLKEYAERDGKLLAYPLVLSANEMTALVPKSEDDWTEGFHGIMEPKKETCLELKPEEIDLVICPCTAFDEECGRMGMGAGYYDRYLEKCDKGHIVAVAFECQKADSVMRQEWDKPMEKVFTEERVYGK